MAAWVMVRREPGIENFWHGDQSFSVSLERGQCIFKMRQIARETKVDRKRLKKSLNRVHGNYTPIEMEKKPYGLLLTFKDADKMLQMEGYEPTDRPTDEPTEGPRKAHGRSTSKKKVKNVKKVENVKSNTYVGLAPDESVKDEFGRFMKWYNETFGKSFTFTDSRFNQWKVRRQKWSKDQIFAAFTNLSKSEFHMGSNKDGAFYANPEFLLRGDDQLDKWHQEQNAFADKKYADKGKKLGSEEADEWADVGTGQLCPLTDETD